MTYAFIGKSNPFNSDSGKNIFVKLSAENDLTGSEYCKMLGDIVRGSQVQQIAVFPNDNWDTVSEVVRLAKSLRIPVAVMVDATVSGKELDNFSTLFKESDVEIIVNFDATGEHNMAEIIQALPVGKNIIGYTKRQGAFETMSEFSIKKAFTSSDSVPLIESASKSCNIELVEMPCADIVLDNNDSTLAAEAA